jgi:hypothetical protein
MFVNYSFEVLHSTLLVISNVQRIVCALLVGKVIVYLPTPFLTLRSIELLVLYIKPDNEEIGIGSVLLVRSLTFRIILR